MEKHNLSGPYIVNEDTIEKNMWYVVLALLPAVIAAFIFFGLYSLYIIFGTALFCVIIEKPFTGQKFPGDGSAFLAGILLALTLPPGVSWWIPVVGAFFTIIIGKQLFGGIGNNIFNPALVARGILLLAWPSQMTSWKAPLDTISTATPLAEYAEAISPAAVINFWDLYLGNVAGSIGETSALALLLGALILYVKGYIGWRIPVSYIVSSVIVAFILGINPLFTVLSGGLLFGALFMATDMVTSPVTKDARLVYGIGCGILTVVIREYTIYPEGITFAILLMNGASYLFDSVFEGPRFGEVEQRKKVFSYLSTLIVASIILLGIGYGTFILSDNLTVEEDFTHTGIGQGMNGEAYPDEFAAYTGSGQGMNDEITVRVIYEEEMIKEIEVIEHSDTENVAEEAFIELTERIIEQQTVEVDTISGATASSEGYLEAVREALEGVEDD